MVKASQQSRGGIFKQEIIRLTKDLIRFKSTHSNPTGIRSCTEFIENYLKDANIEYRLSVHQNVPSILVLPNRQTDFSPVLLMSHIDVVDAPEKLFDPLEKGIKLYGRGSLDDKYAVALSLVLLKKHLKHLKKLGKKQQDLPFGVLITGDEELGGFNGAKKVLQGLTTRFCIVLDGGSVEKIVVKEKGRVGLKLVSTVKNTPAGKPWQGENAIEKLIEDYAKLKTLFVRSSPEHWHRSINFRRIHTGEFHGQTPEYAEALLDIRYTENDNMEELIDWMGRELQSDITVETIDPLFDECELSYLNLLLSISKKTRIGFEDGTNDARFLSVNGIKGIIWGANGDRSQHSLTEHVDMESVYELFERLDLFLKRSGELNTFISPKPYLILH